MANKKTVEEPNNAILGGILKSRKFWASIIALLVSLGILNFASPGGEDQFVEAIMTIVMAIVPVVLATSYSRSVAIEDAGRAAAGQDLDNVPAEEEKK